MSELPGSKDLTFARDERDELVAGVREIILDYVGPTYILDQSYHFVDWNPLFEELIAKPLRLVRGQHAELVIEGLLNVRDVVSRSIDTFGMPTPPQVDTELLAINLEGLGSKRSPCRFQMTKVEFTDGLFTSSLSMSSTARSCGRLSCGGLSKRSLGRNMRQYMTHCC